MTQSKKVALLDTGQIWPLKTRRSSFEYANGTRQRCRNVKNADCDTCPNFLKPSDKLRLLPVWSTFLNFWAHRCGPVRHMGRNIFGKNSIKAHFWIWTLDCLMCVMNAFVYQRMSNCMFQIGGPIRDWSSLDLRLSEYVRLRIH